MSARANPALLAAPAAAGLLGAHALAYRIAGGSTHVDHGYLAETPFLLALLAAVAIATLGLRVARRRPAGRVPAWPFAALPPLAFALQEHLERLLPGGPLPTHLLTERVFLVGLALQLPFGLAAWLLARGLAAAADAVAAALAPQPRPRLRPRSWPRPSSLPLPRAAGLLGTRAARGPPPACVE